MIVQLSLQEIAHRLDMAQVPWAVFAGAAVALYANEGGYSDVDILIRCEDGQCVADLFPEAFTDFQEDGTVGCIEFPGVEIIAGLSFYCSLAMDDAMIARLERQQLDGVSVSLVCLEDNIAIKAMFGRGPEIGKQDWDHVAQMMSPAKKLDWDYLAWRLHDCVPDRAEMLLMRLRKMWAEKDT